MLSLFVLSLPRSLSTEVHRLCCDALELASPQWTSAGEILNLDRFSLNAGRSANSPKYIQRKHGVIFDGAVRFLDDLYLREGHCYKDVTQPFVVSSWLRRNPEIRTLKIMPNIPHVAFAMMNRRWLYPTVASRQIGDEATMMVEGLLMAEAVLRELPGDEIAFETLLQGTAELEAILARHAGAAALKPVSLPGDFERGRDAVLARRTLDAFKRLEDLEHETRAQMVQRFECFMARKRGGDQTTQTVVKAASRTVVRPAKRVGAPHLQAP